MSDTDLPPINFDELPESPVIDAVETDPDNNNCPECGKEINTKRGLAIHLSRIHGQKAPKADSAPRQTGVRKTNIEKELVEFFGLIGMVISMIPHPQGLYALDGQVILQNAERNAHAWANLCNQNKQVEKLIRGILKSTAIGEVFTAAIFTAIPIMANHGKLPPQVAMMFAGPDNSPNE